MVGFEFLSSASVSVNHFISVVLLLVLRYFHAIHSSLIEPNIDSCSTAINEFRVNLRRITRKIKKIENRERFSVAHVPSVEKHVKSCSVPL